MKWVHRKALKKLKADMRGPIKATIYCIVENKDRILLSEDLGKPGWKLPGGEVEKNELLLDAARREVKEETGFEVEITGLISILEYIKWRKDGEHRLRFHLVARRVGGKEKLMADEVEQIRWFDRDEIHNLREDDFYTRPYYLAVRDYLAGKIYPVGILQELVHE